MRTSYTDTQLFNTSAAIVLFEDSDLSSQRFKATRQGIATRAPTIPRMTIADTPVQMALGYGPAEYSPLDDFSSGAGIDDINFDCTPLGEEAQRCLLLERWMHNLEVRENMINYPERYDWRLWMEIKAELTEER
ncbi:hypothetical protein AC579_8214 [Pseudocercospora musae]|uniref:Uncharacterized protein n=1 Tax=Pseudocercospora musae TaxID=113226 RepID=A0A139IVJ4_9PEZI|nr:hypothetical protein AC579_8214 [Pseudocercospora musae]